MKGKMAVGRAFGGYPLSRLGYPVVPLRLYFGLFFTLPFFAFLAFVAHVRFGWFTSLRQLYLVIGTALGLLGGYVEASLVTKRLREKVELVAWFLIPLGLVIWLLPLVYVYSVVGGEELLPFSVYFLFSSIEAASITNGFLYRRFEKMEGVRVFCFIPYVPYPKYWIETPKTLEIELYGFFESMAQKDTSWILYYGRYAKQLRELLIKLSKREDELGKKISEIKELSLHLLDKIVEFNRKGLRVALTFVMSCVLWIILVFYTVVNNYFGMQPQYVGTVIFAVIFPLIFIYTFMKRRNLTRDYERVVQKILEEINLQTQTAIKEVLRLLS
jgi:hypothetical protein